MHTTTTHRAKQALEEEIHEALSGEPDGVMESDVTRLKLLTATNRRLTSHEVAELILLFGKMVAQADQDRWLRKAAEEMATARRAGNPTDLWRAIGRIESLVHPNGNGAEVPKS